MPKEDCAAVLLAYGQQRTFADRLMHLCNNHNKPIACRDYKSAAEHLDRTWNQISKHCGKKVTDKAWDYFVFTEKLPSGGERTGSLRIAWHLEETPGLLKYED